MHSDKMSQEKSKKQTCQHELDVLDIATLKEEIRRGRGLLDRCVTDIAQVKWILIAADDSLDQIPTHCPSCKSELQLFKKVLNSGVTSLGNTKLQSTSAKTSTSTSKNPGPSKNKALVEAGKQKAMPAASAASAQKSQKGKSDLSDKSSALTSNPTARRTGGPPGKSAAKIKKLEQLNNILKKAKLAQVSLQCVGAIMKGKKLIDIKEIPKRDQKFQIDTSLFEEKKDSSKAKSSSSKHPTFPTHSKPPLKKSSHSRDKESEVKNKNVKNDKPKKLIRTGSHEEKPKNVDPRKSRKDSTASVKQHKLEKRRHSSSGSSNSSKTGSCSTCSSSTIETNPKVSVKPQAAKKPKITVFDEEENKAQQHKIKVSRDTFSVIKSKAAVKYHDPGNRNEPKSIRDQNGKYDEKIGKTKVKKAPGKSDDKPNNSTDVAQAKSKVNKSADTTRKQTSADCTKAKSNTFDQLKTNLESDPAKKYSKEKEAPTAKPHESERQMNTSESSGGTKTKHTEIAQNVDSEVELKIQQLLAQLKLSSGGKSELKYIKKKIPLITKAIERGITSLDSPELRAMILEMFEEHKAEMLKKDELAKKAEQQTEKEKDGKCSAVPNKENKFEKQKVGDEVRKCAADSSRISDKSQMTPEVDTETDIPDEDEPLYNEARRLGITSVKSEEYKQLVADKYTTFKNKKSEEMKALKDEAQKVFNTGAEDNNPKPASLSGSGSSIFTPTIFIRTDILEPPEDDDSIELEQDVIGDCLNVITSTAALNSSDDAGEEQEHISTGNQELRGSADAVPTTILTLQDTVSPTAMKKFFSNDSSR